MKPVLNIAWMFPNILNLHGDKGNIMAFKRIANLLGIEVTINKINNVKEINFKNTDLMIFNPGEIGGIKSIINILTEYNDDFKQYIESNKTLILIGTSGIIMGKDIYKKDQLLFHGLGFLDTKCFIRDDVYGNDLVFKTKSGLEIISSQIQMVDTIVEKENSIGEVIHGLGNNDSKLEGATYKNVIFTNALGPVFIKNPWWCEQIIKNIMINKDIKIKKSLTKEDMYIEIQSASLIKEFISNYN